MWDNLCIFCMWDKRYSEKLPSNDFMGAMALYFNHFTTCEKYNIIRVLVQPTFKTR